MHSASNQLNLSPKKVDVWLDVGREGRCFTYLDGNGLGVGIGDLVTVRLRGRKKRGIVLRAKSVSNSSLYKDNNIEEDIKYEFIDELVEPAAIDISWSDWIESSAKICYTSPFRMLKAALPPGWLGSRKKNSLKKRSKWRISLYENEVESVGNDISFRQSELANFLISKGGSAWQRDLQLSGFSSHTINSLVLTGKAKKEKQVVDIGLDIKAIEESLESLQNKSPELTFQQKNSIDVFNSLKPGSAMLLWGVTGSGKTEVYIQLAYQTVLSGKSCLILTPEIGLIPQLVDRFRERFGDRVFEYHSGCSENERASTWRNSRRSLIPVIVVGTRSAIFLPLNPMGLIVLDEEHDSSYKQEAPMPCYNARDLALNRAKLCGARIVLGSATPSLITWKNLKPNGPIFLAKLTCRIADRSLPKVQIIDMRDEFIQGHRRLISRYLMKRISSLSSKGQQAVILVPRRGYSSFVSCRSCGETVQCPHCDVALTLHRDEEGTQSLQCHWCDFRSSFGNRCNECGSIAFKPFGAGTQRVLEKLVMELNGLRVLRFDRDTTGGRDGHRNLLERFASGDADVLIGTQMLAKGMDLPNVTIAAVIAADGLLNRPDLNASEQSLQLFMQLAGRAGRGETPGELIVQTYSPSHPVITNLKEGCYEKFLREEAKLREQGSLVPFSRACLLRLSGESPAETASSAAAVAKKVKSLCDCAGWVVIGPAPSMVSRIAGKSRWQILLHGPEDSDLPLPKDRTSLWQDLPKGISLSVDPDPIQI